MSEEEIAEKLMEAQAKAIERMNEAKEDTVRVPSGLTENMKHAEEVYHAVYDKLDEERAYIVRSAQTMFFLGHLAYRGVIDGDTDIAKIVKAGHQAWKFTEGFAALLRDTSKTRDEMIAILDKTDRWLKSKGAVGILEEYDSTGCVHHKTAAGLVSDMENYAAVYMEYINKTKRDRDASQRRDPQSVGDKGRMSI